MRDGPSRFSRGVSPWIPYALGLFTGLFLTAGVLEVLRGRETDVALYRAVRDLVRGGFVEEVDEDALVDDALRGMIAALDPYSRYYDAQELSQLDRETSGTFTGIGVVFRPPAVDRQVLFPVPGSPAHDMIRVGDRILAMDGVELSSLPADALQRRMAENEGQPVVLSLESLAGEQREERLVPDTIVDPTVRHSALLDRDRGIGYLAVIAFSSETPREFDVEVEHLAERGMRSLIVDLRGNPGGVMQSAVALANRFVPEGDLLVTRSREGARAYRAEPADATLEGTPLVLLVDRDSASASEILAGAVQDYRVGALVGEPTYGKGMVQTLQPFGARAVVKYTTSLYYTPANRQIDRAHTSECAVGIDPDLLVPMENEDKLALRRHLASFSPPHDSIAEIRAWEERAGLELLPDWPADPQRDAAVNLLAGRLDAEAF